MSPSYAHKELYAASVGITIATLEGWIARHWQKHREYVVIGHQTLVNIKRADEWISRHGRLESDQAEAESESSSGKAAGSATRKLSRATHTRPLTLPQRYADANI